MAEPRKIIVTGATGFIGSALVAALREAGDAVTVLSRDAERARAALGEVTAVAADLQGPGPWTAALAGADAIVHLAGEPIGGRRWNARQKQRLRDSRVETTRTIVEAIAALPADSRPRALISASGVDYYPFAPDTDLGGSGEHGARRSRPRDATCGARGTDLSREPVSSGAQANTVPAGAGPRDATRGGVNGPAPPVQGGRESPPVDDDDEVDERAAPGDSFLARLCRDWEAEARGAEALGLRVVCMRTGMVLGPGGALARLTTPFRLFVGGPIGSGRQWVAWIHRDDAVRAYAAAIGDARYAGPINLVTGSVRNAELARAVGEALGRPSWLPVPGFALRVALGELADYALHGRRVVPKRLQELGFTWTRSTLADALDPR